ncbi:hypothetical protein CDAR_400951 [Caerostris darwini]|uniref:Uncharacterized protein n=1 Tax=Caerostris darwini TaxID=1538125 RepID=A0AAV4TJY2_9ARAC|nr:hypothetical protein CDAR_400951 [Caerostris darwini]
MDSHWEIRETSKSLGDLSFVCRERIPRGAVTAQIDTDNILSYVYSYSGTVGRFAADSQLPKVYHGDAIGRNETEREEGML